MTERVRVGVVGLGAVAQAVHRPILARRADLFEPVAPCDLSPALEAGVAVFREKPLAYTLTEADALGAADGRLALGYMKLYDPALTPACELARERPLARSVEVTVLHPSPAEQLAHARVRRWSLDIDAETLAGLHAEEETLLERALGPVVAELGRLYADVLLGGVVHDLALVRALAGDPLRIDQVDVWPQGVRPSVSIQGVLWDQARLSIRWHYLDRHPAYREELRVHDEQGTLADGGAARAASYESIVEAFERELEAFHRLSVAGERAAAGVVEGRADILTCQRVVRRLGEQRGLELGGEAAAA